MVSPEKSIETAGPTAIEFETPKMLSVGFQENCGHHCEKSRVDCRAS